MQKRRLPAFCLKDDEIRDGDGGVRNERGAGDRVYAGHALQG